MARDREDPSCPLHGRGEGRGSRRLVWSYEEVRAYLAWVVAPSTATPRRAR